MLFTDICATSKKRHRTLLVSISIRIVNSLPNPKRPVMFISTYVWPVAVNTEKCFSTSI